MLTLTSEQSYCEYHLDSKFQANISPSDNVFKNNQKNIYVEFKGKHHDELRKFSSGTIQNEVLTIPSEHTYSEYHFDRNF